MITLNNKQYAKLKALSQSFGYFPSSLTVDQVACGLASMMLKGYKVRKAVTDTPTLSELFSGSLRRVSESVANYNATESLNNENSEFGRRRRMVLAVADMLGPEIFEAISEDGEGRANSLRLALVPFVRFDFTDY